MCLVQVTTYPLFSPIFHDFFSFLNSSKAPFYRVPDSVAKTHLLPRKKEIAPKRRFSPKNTKEGRSPSFPLFQPKITISYPTFPVLPGHPGINP